MTVEDALAALFARDPTALRLAEVASLAVEIEPALLRRLRRSLVPDGTPLAEALLWSSNLACARTPASLLLRDDVLVMLRERLREDQDRLDAARAVVEEAHQGIAEVLRCEEDLVYFGLIDLARKPRAGLDGATLERNIRARIEQVLRSIAEDADSRENLLAWSSRALPTLPARVQTHEAGTTLAALASAGLLLAGDAWSAVFPPSERDVGIRARWTSTGLILSTTHEDTPALRLPPIEPFVVEVEAATGEDWAPLGRVVVPPQGTVRLDVGVDVPTLRLSSLRGDGVMLHRQPDESRSASALPSFTHVWVLVAGTARKDLPPLEFQAAEGLGEALAERGLGLLTGAFRGVDRVASRAFLERLASFTGADDRRLEQERLLRVIWRGRTPDFPRGSLLEVDSLPEEFWEPVERAIAVIVIGKAKGTRQVALAAGRAGRPVVAYPGTGADALPGAVSVPEADASSEFSLAEQVVRSVLQHASPSAVSRWAGEELMALATRYLRPQPLKASDAVASRLRTEIRRRTSETGVAVPEAAFHSDCPPERVIRYLATQLSPEARWLAPLLGAISREIPFADRFSETRPMWQGLMALKGVLALPEVRRDFLAEAWSAFFPDAQRDFAGRLREILASLESSSHIDEGGECKALVRSILSEAGRIALEDFASRYEKLRQTLPSGPQRTLEMDGLFAEIRGEAMRLGVKADQIARMYETGRAGLRMVALACCAGLPAEAPAHTIADALGSPRTPFEQWAALLATTLVLEAGEAARAEPLIAATRAALADPANIINDRADSSRRLLAARVLKSGAASSGADEARLADAVSADTKASAPAESAPPKAAQKAGGAKVTAKKTAATKAPTRSKVAKKPAPTTTRKVQRKVVKKK